MSQLKLGNVFTSPAMGSISPAGAALKTPHHHHQHQHHHEHHHAMARGTTASASAGCLEPCSSDHHHHHHVQAAHVQQLSANKSSSNLSDGGLAHSLPRFIFHPKELMGCEPGEDDANNNTSPALSSGTADGHSGQRVCIARRRSLTSRGLASGSSSGLGRSSSVTLTLGGGSSGGSCKGRGSCSSMGSEGGADSDLML